LRFFVVSFRPVCKCAATGSAVGGFGPLRFMASVTASRARTCVTAEMTLSGTPATEKLVDYLVKRIRKSEHNIKEKALLVVKVGE
jgi:hypothetical protein